MTLKVRGIPPPLVEPGDNLIRAAHPVRGHGQWHAMGEAANWITGVGGALASSGIDAAAPEAPLTRRFWVWPRTHHLTWLWTVSIMSDDEEGAKGTITLTPGGDTVSYDLPDRTTQTLHIVQDHATVTQGEATLELTVDEGYGIVVLTGMCINEVKRGYLSAEDGEVGTHETTCTKDTAIYEDGDIPAKFASAGVWATTRAAKVTARRQKMFDWSAVGSTGDVTITTTAFPGTSNIFAIDPALQTRNMADGGATTGTIYWNVRAHVPGGGSGEVRITMTTGGTSTMTVVNTTADWQTPLTFSVESDDLSETNHIRGGTRDVAVIDARVTTASSIVITAISIGEGYAGA